MLHIQVPNNDEKEMPSLKWLASVKASGLDIVNEDLTDAIQYFSSTNDLLRQWNSTLVTSIPKINSAITFKDFRLISLTSVCYKMITKITANRLKPTLDQIVSPNHVAFLEGRVINLSKLPFNFHKNG